MGVTAAALLLESGLVRLVGGTSALSKRRVERALDD